MLDDLDEVAARVVEHGGRDRAAHLQGLLLEPDAEPAQPLELRVDVVHGECSGRDAVRDQGRLVRPDRGMPVGLQQQLGAVGIVR